jgi:4-amino-4-deoxy-L-arabinose transferase-like glycosyltransferase
MRKAKIIELLFLIFIFFLAFLLRCYKIDNPVADWHSWRQADTASVAFNFAKEGINILYPRSFKNPSIHSNPNNYFLNEFPLYNAGVAVIYNLFGVREKYARLLSVFISSLTVITLYLLVKKYSSYLVAGLSAFFFAVLPYNIYYGRVIMPEPTFIFFSVFSLYLITCWLEKESFVLSVVSGLSLALAMLTKPYAIFLGLPIGYLIIKKWGLEFYKKKQVYLVAILSLAPLMLWRYHINQHPEGMFGSQWLINATNIRFKGSFFRWIIFDRMNRLIFATGGFVLFWLGVVASRNKKESLFFLIWLLSVFAYISYFAKGNVTHDYYQMPLVPIGCYFMAKGFAFLVQKRKDLFSYALNSTIAFSLVLLMLAFGWYEVRGFFNINRWEIVKAGQAVNRSTPVDAKVIAPYNNDPAFLYQTYRFGWSELRDAEELKQFVKDGATHYVSVDFDDITNDLIKVCDVLEKTDEYVIIDLQNCNL